ncbi:hypothetical protein [Streptomyces sp. NPDC001642]|uniref:hypothetical protein n=1 Tax=Streptomyces sp. NPDC001642 TaxID=3154392 RepID=UPI00332060A0
MARPTKAQRATVCFWRETPTLAGEPAPAADGNGAGYHLELVCEKKAVKCVDNAASYFDMEVDPAAVEHVYRMERLTEAVVAALSLETNRGGLDLDVTAIGYTR